MTKAKSKKQTKPVLIIEPRWLAVLSELDKKMKAKKFEPFIRPGCNYTGEEEVTFLELTAIASSKNPDDISDIASVSYEEDEDCDYTQTENDMLRHQVSSGEEYWTFEVSPLSRSHPQMALQYGFIAAKSYEAAKAELMALPDWKDPDEN